MRAAFSLSFAAFVALASAQIDLSDLPDGISLEDLPSNVAELIPTAMPSQIPSDIPDSVRSLIPSGVLASATQSGPAPTGTGSSSGALPSLVQELPICAVNCLKNSSSSIGCGATDFSCLCGKSEQLIASISSCVLDSDKSGCTLNDGITAGRVAPQICDRINQNPSSEEVASASSLVAGAIETGAATTTGSNGDDGSGAGHIGVGAALFASVLAIAIAF